MNEMSGLGAVYFAMGSGVTPNHASSVIQIPLSYLSQILKRWNQYLHKSEFFPKRGNFILRTFAGVREIDQHLTIDGCHPVHRPSCLGGCPSWQMCSTLCDFGTQIIYVYYVWKPFHSTWHAK